MPLIGAVAVIAAGGLAWYLMTRESNPRARSFLSPETNSSRGALQTKTPVPPFGTPEFKQRMLERSAAWLAARGRDARGLMAISDLTGDKSFLNEAVEKFPDDPRTILAKIHSLHLSDPDHWEAIERMIALDPDNPEGFFLKARAYMNNTVHPREAMEAIRAAAAKPRPRESYLADRLWTMHEASMAAGASEADALRHALSAMHADHSVSMFSNLEDAILGELNAANAAGNTALTAELAGVGLNITGKFAAGGPMPLQLELFAARFRQKLLATLPADTIIASDGTSAAVLRTSTARDLAGIEAIARGGDGNPSAATLLASAGDPAMLEYFRI